MFQGAAQQYKQNQVETSSPEELTLMLYNGAITFIKQAQQAIETKDFNSAHHFISRSQDIVIELILGLDRNYPIAEQLLLLYDYLKRRLIEANVAKDIAILEEVKDFFIEFRNTWKEAIILARSQSK